MHVPIYAGRKYEASYLGDYLVEYACPNCQYECDVEVRAKGLGTGHSPYFTDDGGAKEEALDNAQYASAKNARCTVKLLACPRCKQRSRSAIFSFILFAMLKMILVSVPFVLFGAYFLSGHYYHGFGWLMVAVGVISALAVYITSVHPRWHRAGARSRFVIPDPGQNAPL
ncbi:MAG TPA: hypothetical protein VM425_20090 [Myxococcota bacterium]|nr:hypothetical protein [Myxococcota bacterium]